MKTTYHPNSQRLIYLLVAFLLAAACANAQTKPTSQDTIKALQQELQRVQTEVPVSFLVTVKGSKAFSVDGFIKGNEKLDTAHKPLAASMQVWVIVERKVKTK